MKHHQKKIPLQTLNQLIGKRRLIEIKNWKMDVSGDEKGEKMVESYVSIKRMRFCNFWNRKKIA